MATHANYVGALFATQVLLHLYGAGLRRPFGTLATVKFLPQWLREAHNLVFAVDCIFVGYIVIMWIVLAGELGLVTVVFFGVLFSLVGDYLSVRIALIPSFYLSGILVFLTLFALVNAGGGGQVSHTVASFL